jgi:hypothetical protein
MLSTEGTIDMNDHVNVSWVYFNGEQDETQISKAPKII